MRLTEFSIRALSVEKGQRTFFDDTFKGFGVRVSQGGAKSYVLVSGKARKLTTIGRVDRLGLKEAREKARAILYAPKDEKPTLIFKAALDTFLAMRVRPNNRASTAAETERLITRHFSSLYDRPIASLKTGDFLAITNNLIVADKPSECKFRSFRQAISVQSGRLFRSKPAACFGPKRHPFPKAFRCRPQRTVADELIIDCYSY